MYNGHQDSLRLLCFTSYEMLHVYRSVEGLYYTYTVKKVSDFPVPSRDVTNQTLSGRE
jgi:hypothetical protein